MRKIDYIVLHCTATPQSTTVESIQRYWKKDLGWRNPGYHFLIESNGFVNFLLDVEEIANGAKGFNHNSIHIAYIGGIDADNNPIDNRTIYQKNAQLCLLNILKRKYPDAEILGHRDLPNVNKDCPSFDVKEWLKEIGEK